MGSAAAAAGVIQSAGQIAGLMESRKARKDAEKDKAENKRKEALTNLANSLLGGQARNTPASPLPQVGYGQALTGLGAGIGDAVARDAASTRQAELDKINAQTQVYRDELIQEQAGAAARSNTGGSGSLSSKDIQDFNDLIKASSGGI